MSGHRDHLELLVHFGGHQNDVVLEASHARQVGLELAGKLLLEDLGRIHDEHDPVEELGHFALELVVLEVAQLGLDRRHLLMFRLHAQLELLRL